MMDKRILASPQLFLTSQIRSACRITVDIPALAKRSQAHYLCCYYVEQKNLPAEPCQPAELWETNCSKLLNSAVVCFLTIEKKEMKRSCAICEFMGKKKPQIRLDLVCDFWVCYYKEKCHSYSIMQASFSQTHWLHCLVWLLLPL